MCLILPYLARSIVLVGRRGQETRERQADRGDRTAELEVGEGVAQIPRRGGNPRKADRGVEKRLGGRPGDLRSPVVAARRGQVEHLFPPHFDRCKDRLRLIVPADLLGALLRVVEVEYVEDIGKAVLLNRTAVRKFVGLDVVERSADVGRERPIVAEGLVDVQHHVGIGLRIVGTGFGIVSVLAAVGDGRVGRGVKFLRIERIGVVETHTSRNAQPRQDVVAGRERQHVALFVGIAQVAVGDPVGILHAQVAALHVRRPELLHEFGAGIIAFEFLVNREILAARKEIGRDQRVRIYALIGHVLVLLIDIAGAGVEPQFIFQEVRGVAESKVVAIVFVVGDDAVGIDRCGGKIGLVLVRTAGNGHGVGVHVSRFEEVGGRIAVAGRGQELLSPAVNARTAPHAVRTRAVTVLELRLHERIEEFGIARKRHFERAGLALFRRDHDGAVGGVRTVKGRSGGTREHRHRLDILRVDVRDGFRGAARIELRTSASAEVIHRDSVDDIERIGRLADGLVATKNHLRRAADARRGGVDRNARDLARQRIDEVGILDRGDVLGLDLLDVVTQGLLLTLDAEGGDNDALDFGSRFVKRDVEGSPVADGNHDGFVPQKINLQLGRSRGGGYLKRESSVHVRTRADGRAFDHDGRPDDGNAVDVADLSRHGDGFFRGFLGKNDVRAVDLIRNIRIFEHVVQYFLNRFLRQID